MTEAKSLFVVLSGNASAYHAMLQGAGRDTDRFGDQVDDMGNRVDNAGLSIDKMSGRLGLFVRAGVVATPVVSALAAAAVPLVTTMANLAGVTTLAAGATAVAFQGIADGYKSLQKFQDDPTAENLQAVHDEFEKLSPAARDLIVTVDELAPALASVRDAGATALFPGVERSLENVQELIPGMRRFVRTYAGIVGEIAASSTESLTTDRWSEFGSFLKGEARSTLTGLASVVGDTAHGLSELWMAFDPANDSILASLERGANTFDQWAGGLEGTEKFEEFLTFLAETGPLVRDTTGEVADSILQIGEAASPLSGGLLTGLEGFFSLLSDVADSDAGSFLFTLAAAMAAASLAQRGWAAASGTGVAASLRGQSAAVRGLYGDLRLLAAGYQQASAAQRILTTQLLAQRTGKALRAAAPGVGIGLGIAALSTGVADEMGLANTATLALTGAMVGGVPGAIAGGLVGAFLDVKAGGKQVEDQIDSLAAAMDGGAETLEQRGAEMVASWAAVRKAQQDSAEGATSVGDFFSDVYSPNAVGGIPDVLLGGEAGEQNKELEADALAASQATFNLVMNLQSVGEELGRWGDDNPLAWTEDLSGNIDEFGVAFQQNFASVQGVINSITPAMQELGLTLSDLEGVDATKNIGEIAKMVGYLDSAAGRAEALTDSIMGLDNGLLSTAESAGIFSDALDAALDPSINVSAQTDAWITSLRELHGELNKDNKTLEGNTNAAIQNRTAIRDRVTQLKATLTAQAEAGASSRELARSLAQQRSSLINTGIAANLSGDKLRKFLKELGLTPKLVKTTMRLAGAEQSTAEVRKLRREFAGLPRAVRSIVRTEGIPKSKKDAIELADRLHLVGQDRRALIKLAAAGVKEKITDIDELLDKVNKNDPEPKVTVNTSQANAAIHATQTLLNNLNSKTITITTIHRSRNEKADGGIFDGPISTYADGGHTSAGRYVPRASRIAAGGASILWAEPETHWETYISGKPSQRARNKGIWMETGRRLGYDMRPRGSQHVGGMTSTQVVHHVHEHRITVGGELDASRALVAIDEQMVTIAADEINADRNWRKRHLLED